jgi:hypothetical protein
VNNGPIEGAPKTYLSAVLTAGEMDPALMGRMCIDEPTSQDTYFREN